MKLIDRSKDAQADQNSKGMPDWMKAMLVGEASSREFNAQEDVIEILNQSLDHRFYLLRNVSLEGSPDPIHFILVGPPGVWVISPSAQRGVYRVKGEYLEELDEKRKKFRTARSNPIAEAASMTHDVSVYLAGRGYDSLQVEPVVIFTDPGIHVDQVAPAVRIVLIDAISRFTHQLMQTQPSLSMDQIQNLISVLDHRREEAPEEIVMKPDQDAFSFQEVNAPRKPQRGPTVIEQRVNALTDRLERVNPFSSSQWIVLSLMAMVNIILLAILVIYILLVN